MKEGILRRRLGLFLIISHFGILATIFLLAVIGNRFTMTEMLQAAGVIMPLFAAYTTVILRYFMEMERSLKGKTVPTEKTIVSIGIPVLFVVFVSGIIYWKAFLNGDFDLFLNLVAFTETAFGVYVGIIINSHYKSESSD